MPHCADLPIPKPPMLESLSSASASEEEGRDADFDEASTVQAKSRTFLISKKWMT